MVATTIQCPHISAGVRTLNGSCSSDLHFTAIQEILLLLLLGSEIQTQHKQTMQTILQN